MEKKKNSRRGEGGREGKKKETEGEKDEENMVSNQCLLGLKSKFWLSDSGKLLNLTFHTLKQC